MNRWVFRARRNECRVDAAVTVDDRLCHALAAATKNVRSPSDDLLVAGTTSAGELNDLSGPPCQKRLTGLAGLTLRGHQSTVQEEYLI